MQECTWLCTLIALGAAAVRACMTPYDPWAHAYVCHGVWNTDFSCTGLYLDVKERGAACHDLQKQLYVYQVKVTILAILKELASVAAASQS